MTLQFVSIILCVSARAHASVSIGCVHPIHEETRCVLVVFLPLDAPVPVNKIHRLSLVSIKATND
jgi:hypothetical protein